MTADRYRYNMAHLLRTYGSENCIRGIAAYLRNDDFDEYRTRDVNKSFRQARGILAEANTTSDAKRADRMWRAIINRSRNAP